MTALYPLAALSIPNGSTLGPYEIVAQIGAGGMGEVYRARDPRIGREVAVKVLPPGFAGSEERLRRFEQESRAAGMLHHPNLLTVFDVGADNGAPYIVSELLEGETLRTKLEVGAVPIRKTIDYARQIAAGLGAAHEKGIVHRDLKPENIFVTRDGQVKILDFGLAKLSGKDGESLTNGATVERGTDPGTILGTVGYMSPEQVRAQNVDQRSDIFSLGSILYEMLTGRRAFRGGSNADTMSAILREDPPEISVTNANIPPALERIVRHCLEKDAEQRFQSARDLAFDLDSLSGSGIQPLALLRSPRRVPPLLLPIATLIAGLAIGLAIARWRQPGPALPPIVRLLTYSGHDLYPAVSPDGKTMAFASTRDGRSRIWLKDLASGGEIPLTEGEDMWPRFSPDGTSILFTRKESASRYTLWRTSVVGGTPRRLIPDVGTADWSNDGRSIVFLRNGGTATAQTTTLATATADGSAVTPLRTMPRRYAFPRYSPDGKWIALTDVTPGNLNGTLLAVSSDGKSTREITATGPTYAGVSSTSWIDNDHLLYGASQSATTFTNLGTQILVVDVKKKAGVRVLQTLSTIATVEVSGENRVIFDTVILRQNLREIPFGAAARASRWLTRSSGIDRQPAYSPDGARIVFSSNRTGNLDIWTVATKDGSLTRITDDAADDYDPAFTHDGKHLLWSSNRAGHFEIWIADSDGSGARQLTSDGADAENPTATPDGQWVIYNSYNPQKLGVWKIRMDGSAATPVVKASTELPEVSPDGQYVAFHLLAPANELDVARLSTGEKFKVAEVRGQTSQIGAGRPRWTPDGKTLGWVDIDEKNNWGVNIQPFTFGSDTSAHRRALAGFDAELHVESFGFAPDGGSVTLSVLEELDAIYGADGVGGVQRPRR